MGNDVRDSKAKSVPVLNLVTATSLSSGAGSARRTTVAARASPAGWPQGARLNSIVEETIAKAKRE